MAEKVIRTKTKYKSIYFNENTQKYDVKYNYKVYNPVTQKNDYKSKWIYNLKTLSDAKQQLAKLQTQGDVEKDKDITLQGIFEAWKVEAEAIPLSPVTISNTTQHMNMIYQFLPPETKLKNITSEVYYELSAKCRNYGYAEETLYSINSTFRKLINLAYKKEYIAKNILDTSRNISTKKKTDYRLVENEEFLQLDKYYKDGKFIRLGVNNYPKYRFLINVLYYCGVRIGEALALTYADFEEFSYYKKNSAPLRLGPSANDTEQEHLQGMRIRVNKAYVTQFKLTKDPKNVKHRYVPIPGVVERLYYYELNNHINSGGKATDKIFPWGHSAVDQSLSTACKRLDIPTINCHDFRHTYISNLMKNNVPVPVISFVSGDTQQTIWERYSHMFESDEVLVLKALKNL